MGRKRDMKIADLVGKPISEKVDRLEEAVRRDGTQTREEYKKQIGDIKQVVDVMMEDLSAREKKELYDLNTLVDIAELESSEKEFLMAVLYTLADLTEEVTVEQQAYIRSVKKYINVKDMQTAVDLSRIENIDSKKQERAILQTVMEFLFLENCNHDFWDEYSDVLDYFSVKNSEIRKIQASIDSIYKATGAQGLSEKYGYVPIIEEVVCGVEDGFFPVDKIVLTESTLVRKEETKEFLHKEVLIAAPIVCEGTLLFHNCVIKADPKSSFWIGLMKGKLIIRNSILYFSARKYKSSYDSTYLLHEPAINDFDDSIDKNSYFILSINSDITIENTKLQKCDGLIYCPFTEEGMTSISFKQSKGETMDTAFINSWNADCISIEMSSCNFEFKQTTTGYSDRWVGANDITINSCDFYNISRGILAKKKCHVTNSTFDGCTSIFDINGDGGPNDYSITECRFTNCKGQIIDCQHNPLILSGCTFIDGSPSVFGGSNSNVDNCDFDNLTDQILTLCKDSIVSQCIFRNCMKYLVKGSGNGTIILDRCTAENCNAPNKLLQRSSEVISIGTKSGFWGTKATSETRKEYFSYDLRNCKGIE